MVGKITAKPPDLVIPISKKIKEDLKVLNIPESRRRVIPNPVQSSLQRSPPLPFEPEKMKDFAGTSAEKRIFDAMEGKILSLNLNVLVT